MSVSLDRGHNLKPTGKLDQTGPNWPVLSADPFFLRDNKELVWKKYCGFLDISVDEFTAIQNLLLLEQIDLSMGSELGARILGERKPRNVFEFRRFTPLTTYEDYRPFFEARNAKVLTANPVIWTPSAGRTGPVKWIPFLPSSLEALADDWITALILSSATVKGKVCLERGRQIGVSWPSADLTEIAARALNQRLPFRSVTDKTAVSESPQKRLEKALIIALQTGLDYLCASPDMLVDAAEQMVWPGGKRGFYANWHLQAPLRLCKAKIRSRLLKRPIYPLDIWKVKGLICCGPDQLDYKERIQKYWGVQPLEVYFNTETCFLGLQAWNKKALTLIPYRHYYEFIPEEESVRTLQDPEYKPNTLTYGELRAGQIYELVVTNFRGGPFLRYRLGDLIKVVSTEDKEAGIHLPQLAFYGRTAVSPPQNTTKI